MSKRYIFLTVLFGLLYPLPTITVKSQSIGFTCVADGKFAFNACTQYYECLYTNTPFANKKLFDCASGLIFDNKRLLCDYPGNVICDNSVGATTIVTSKQITSTTKRTVTFQKTTGMFKCKKISL
jgi:hypothetical protein